MRWFLLFLAACTTPMAELPSPPDPCALARMTTSGPRAHAAQQAETLHEVATIRLDEARQSGDPGFELLAEQALRCIQTTRALTPDEQRTRANLHLQFHQFTAAQALATGLVQAHGLAADHLLLADAHLEQGHLTDGERHATIAAELSHGSAPLDRLGWHAWLTGDLDAARAHWTEAAVRAVHEGTTARVWQSTQLGWLHAMLDDDLRLLNVAVQLAPHDRTARLLRGRARLHQGDATGAREDLLAAGPTVAAFRARAELDPTVDLTTVRHQDPRGYAIWLTPTDPAAALVLLDAELNQRQDAITRMARAHAAHLLGHDVQDEVRAVLDTGTTEPTVLFQAAQILADDTLAARARAMGPGLLPSQHREVIR